MRASVATLVRVALAAAVFLPGCAFVTRVDSPITLRADRRLEIVSPDDEEVVALPVTIRWTAQDFPLTDGNKFGVFIDRPPLGAKRLLRWRICGEQEKRPISPGEFRLPCNDDRETVFLTNDYELEIECVDTNMSLPERTRNIHSVTVILLDGDDRRIGEGAQTIRFEISERDARRCRGLVD